MERKIGEIFEDNGEWYQTVKSQGKCCSCDFMIDGHCIVDFSSNGSCFDCHRKDKENIIFKKLEKVGEPLKINGKSYQGLISPYGFNNCSMCAFRNISCKEVITCYDDYVYIEIKQTKEDMEEKKMSLKPFDIQKAREGKPVCTRGGRKARIICFDRNHQYPVVALIECKDGEEMIAAFTKDGETDYEPKNNSLMMLPEKKEGWANVYKDSVYDTKDDALIGRSESRGYIDTIKVSWEE